MWLSNPLKVVPVEDKAYEVLNRHKKTEMFGISWETKTSGREKAKQTFIELLVIKGREECS